MTAGVRPIGVGLCYQHEGYRFGRPKCPRSSLRSANMPPYTRSYLTTFRSLLDVPSDNSIVLSDQSMTKPGGVNVQFVLTLTTSPSEWLTLRAVVTMYTR